MLELSSINIHNMDMYYYTLHIVQCTLSIDLIVLVLSQKDLDGKYIICVDVANRSP